MDLVPVGFVVLSGVIQIDSLNLGGHRFPRHAHPEWAISAVQGGTGYFRCSGVSYRARAGAVTVLHPGEAHDGWVCPQEGLRYLVFSLPESALRMLFDFAGTPRFASRVLDDPQVAARLEAARRLLAAQEDVLGVETVLVEALDLLFQRHARCRRASESSYPVEVVRRYLDDRLISKVSVQDLAVAAQVHPATLLRRFRAETGLAPYEYVVSRRVGVARRLLAGGMAPAEVSARAGFADQSHLNRHFKRIVGVTPGRFVRP